MARSDFLNLPCELRDMIYEQEILSSNHGSISGPDLLNAFVHVFHPDKPEYLDDLASETTDLALMISHPQIFLEYWPALLKHQTVTVDANWLVSVLDDTPSALPLLGAHCRSLILDIRGSDEEIFELAIKTISRWPKLTNLEFDVDPSDKSDIIRQTELLPFCGCDQHAFPMLKEAKVDFSKLEVRHGLDNISMASFGVFSPQLSLQLRWLEWRSLVEGRNWALRIHVRLLHGWRDIRPCSCD